MATVTFTDQITLSLTVRNRAATSKWFQDHFGLEELFSNDEMGWTELSTMTPGVTLGFADADEPSVGNCVPVFGVEDCDAARAALEERDVRFDGETMHMPGMAKLATFYDPDGNAFMSAQDLTRHPD